MIKKHLFLTILEAEKFKTKMQGWVSGEGLLPGS